MMKSYPELRFNNIVFTPLSTVGAGIMKWHLSSLQIAVPAGKVLLPSAFRVFMN
jgi:hypothetical protein